jgi:hypothetical protein
MLDIPAAAESCRSPVFILTASRSGSTLLRFILDSHPEFACPPETNITSMCAQIARTWDIIENASADSSRPVDDEAPLSPEAIAAIRDSVDRVYGHYLRRRDKQRWCDKSLDSQQHAELMTKVYPEAKFICLYRHCMDVIASGVEACPWGLHRFGFDPFVAQNPGNSVAAIGSYWLTTVRAMLAFEEKHPESCHRVRYEDLVSSPERSAAEILSFLGAEQVAGLTTHCFGSPHDGNGPGDEKIWFTREVTADSLGRGLRVPAEALPPQTRQGVNGALEKLGYRLVDDEWNAAVEHIDPRAHPDGAAISLASVARPTNGTAAAERPELEATIRSIDSRIRSLADAELREINNKWPGLAGQTVAIIVQGPDGEHEELSWNFGGTADRGLARGSEDAPKAVAAIIGGPDVWRSLLQGKANMVAEIMAGRLRCVNRRDGHRIRSDEVHALAVLLGLSQVPVARAPRETAAVQP